MGINMQCHKCGTMLEPDFSRNVGTFWQPLYSGNCPDCGEENHSALNGFDVDRMIASFIGPEKLTTTPVEKRIADNAVIELFVQRYIVANYEQLGFADLKGPFGHGPDFELLFNGRWVIAEAEVFCKNYVKHKHHEDPRWSACEVLIVLESNDPAKEIAPNLPKTVKHIDKVHFREWFRPIAMERAEAREKAWPATRAAGIANWQMMLLQTEIRNRFGIPSEEEDDGLGATELVDDLAFEFAMRWTKGRETEEFNFSDVSPEAIDEFCASVAAHVNEILPDLGVYVQRDGD